MTTREVVIGHRLGLHARAAARLVKLASGYRSAISLCRADASPPVEADARSILAVLLMAAGHGTRITVRAVGEDEDEALNAVCAYLEG